MYSRIFELIIRINMSIIKKSYDVIISGAGPVGSIAALALSKTPYIQNILIIEKYKPKLALT